jgi:hypothetical protein
MKYEYYNKDSLNVLDHFHFFTIGSTRQYSSRWQDIASDSLGLCGKNKSLRNQGEEKFLPNTAWETVYRMKLLRVLMQGCKASQGREPLPIFNVPNTPCKVEIKPLIKIAQCSLLFSAFWYYSSVASVHFGRNSPWS